MGWGGVESDWASPPQHPVVVDIPDHNRARLPRPASAIILRPCNAFPAL